MTSWRFAFGTALGFKRWRERKIGRIEVKLSELLTDMCQRGWCVKFTNQLLVTRVAKIFDSVPKNVFQASCVLFGRENPRRWRGRNRPAWWSTHAATTIASFTVPWFKFWSYVYAQSPLYSRQSIGELGLCRQSYPVLKHQTSKDK